MNFVQIAGHLGADPVTRMTQSGKKVTTLTVACNSRKAGQETTIWWRVTIWEDDFKNLLPHLKKGSAVIIYGEMQKPDIFTNREGKPQVSMEMRAIHIQFSPFGKSANPQGGGSQQSQYGSAHSENTAEMNPYAGFPSQEAHVGSSQFQGTTFDDEVPF